jgi:hypothetical protein
MTREQAISIVCDIASRWGENTEEGFPRRLQATDTDAALKEMTGDTGGEYYELEDLQEVRDLWQAIELLQKETGHDHQTTT